MWVGGVVAGLDGRTPPTTSAARLSWRDRRVPAAVRTYDETLSPPILIKIKGGYVDDVSPPVFVFLLVVLGWARA